MKRSAIIERGWRYELRRIWAIGRPLVFCGLNPSTADARYDDQTIRILIRRARLLDMASLLVVNLYAYRATDPERLWSVEDAIGPRNNAYIIKALKECHDKRGIFLCGWGNNAPDDDRSAQIARWADYHRVRPMCLGVTQFGQPKHPLRISYATELEAWSAN